ncbi:hypothetical protein H0H92_004092 [Tricholoma furcatifolium]|nr:hypothetical protein H0H92_004092 [Tricholoma furcatifolium]
MAQVSLFLIGASGFIGGNLLTSLLARGARQRFDITVLIRGEDRAALIREKLGLKTVVADLGDTAVISAAAENADVVINTANADHPLGAAAIIEGLIKRKAKTGKTGIYIHSSGTGALTDGAEGEFKSEKVYDDEHVEAIKAIPVDYVHRACDSVISAAGEAGDIRSYIVMPPLISLIRSALKLGQACYYGKGLPWWNGVHVQDLTDLYLILLDDALSANPVAPHGAEGFYFCSTDSYEWKQFAQEIATRLYAHGAIPTSETRSFTDAEATEALGTWAGFAYGSNSRSIAHKAFTLGWNPEHGDGNDGLFESIIPEYHAVLEEGKDQAPIVHFDEMYALGKK